MAKAAKSSARTDAKVPPNAPIGVLIPSTIYTDSDITSVCPKVGFIPEYWMSEALKVVTRLIFFREYAIA